MSFTYDAGLLTDRDRVRAFVGDIERGKGILPNGGNVTDEFIDWALSESGNLVSPTVVKVCQAAQAAWASVPEQMSADGMSVKNEVVGKLAAVQKAITSAGAGGGGGGGGSGAGVVRSKPMRIGDEADSAGDEYSF